MSHPTFLCDDGDVDFFLDPAFLEGEHEKAHFHPMANPAATWLSREVFLMFVKNQQHDPIKLKFAQKPWMRLIFKTDLFLKAKDIIIKNKNKQKKAAKIPNQRKN